MNEMYSRSMDGESKLRKRFVIKRFLCAPVVLIGPVVNQWFDLCLCNTDFDPLLSILRLSRKSSEVQLLSREVEISLRDVHAIW